MKHSISTFCVTSAVLFATLFQSAHAQGTAFTYQGRLNDGPTPASGSYDFRFRAATDPLGSNYVGSTAFSNAVPVNNGIFNVTLDFGSIFNGSNIFLEIGVRTNGNGSYTTLSPLQAITSSPYAVTASNLTGNLSATQLTGAVPSAQLSGIYSGALTLNNPANNFTGNGGGLTNVNATTLGGLAPSNYWQLGGNAGANPANNRFLGTTDSLPLELRVGNARALRLEPNAASGAPNVIGGSPANSVLSSVGATIGGGGATNLFGNTAGNSIVLADYGTIGGGVRNVIAGAINQTSSVIGGGQQNSIVDVGSSATDSVISGGFLNSIRGAQCCVIAGGSQNTNQDTFSFIGGGFRNSVQPGGSESVIGGGGDNVTSGLFGTVPGGDQNLAGQRSFAAGHRAKATTIGTFVWADSQEADFTSTKSNQFLIRAFNGVGIGTTNPQSTLDVAGTITASNFSGTTFTGTSLNAGTINGNLSLDMNVNGGRALRLEYVPDDATHTNAPNVIEGSSVNSVTAGVFGATISGGGVTFFQGTSHPNTVTGIFGTIGGGFRNTSGLYATVAGGANNKATGDATFIGGGTDNSAMSLNDTIGGGEGNFANGGFATIAGGDSNTATNRSATVPGGSSNVAGGTNSFAAGHSAEALHKGTFVWSDLSLGSFASTAANQFLIRASGGVGIGTTSPQGTLHVATSSTGITANAGSMAVFEKTNNGYVSFLCPSNNEMGLLFCTPTTTADSGIIFNNVSTRSGLQFRTGTNQTQMTITAAGNVGIGTIAPSRELEVQNIGDTEIGIKSQDAGGHLWTLQSSSVTGSATFDGSFQIIDRTLNADRFYIGTNGNIGIGTSGPTNKLHVIGGITCTALTQTSDRNAKENFKPVSAREVLDKVAKLPISRWNFKELKDGEHMGPMAQDFYAAFGLGGSDKTITAVDPDGVALAAIQGLNEKLAEKDAKIDQLEKRLAALETMMQRK